MNLLYDLSAIQPAEDFKYHGGGEYARQIFQQLISKDISGISVFAFYDEKNWIDPAVLNLARNKGVTLVTIRDKYDVEEIIRRYSIQRFYSGLPYGYYDLDLGTVEFYYSMLGLRRVEMPTDRYEILFAKTWRERAEYIYKQIFRERIINRRRKRFCRLLKLPQTKKIFAISEHTKYSLLINYPFLSHERIVVLYPPRTADVKAASNDVLQIHGIEKKKYFLLINANRWLKNSYRALIAFDRLFSIYPDLNHKVMILGLDEGKIKKRFLNKLNNPKHFIFSGYVERDELERLYQDAFCFVYSTLNEGFGYPPLDCMKYGTPVMASAVTSIPEVCGDGVMYFMPTSVDEIMNRILQLIRSKDTYDDLSRRGLMACNNMMKKQDLMLDQLIEELTKITV